MPKWGLTKSQRETAPWGIDLEWLEPDKTITDPVHKNIYVTRLETALIDSPPMQRLRSVRQLGTSHLVYPGAVHSRFSHALGTLRAAQDLLDAVVDGASGPRGGDVPNLLAEWRTQPASLDDLDLGTEVTGDDGQGKAGSQQDAGGQNDGKARQKVLPPTVFDKHLAEATVLARLGGLLHDICHVPMGHTIEDDLAILVPHDGNADRFERVWNQIPEEVRKAIGPELTKELRPLILSKEKDEKDQPLYKIEEAKYPFVMDIVGNTICADLMDYLRRDHFYCGLPYDVGSRFVDNFYVTSQHTPLRAQRMAIKVSRAGHDRHDILTELGKYLRYRYELSERVLYHHAKVAADAMVGKLLDMWKDALWVSHAAAQHPALNLTEHAGDVAFVQKAVRSNGGDDAVKAIDRWVRDQIEDTFLSWGDDGLLTWIHNEATERATEGVTGRSRYEAVAQLAAMVSNRQLFKGCGRADSGADLADAKALYPKYKEPEVRRTLEEAAARFAGINRGWNVVVWIPAPEMRPKVAEVLVNRNGRVAPLAEVDGINADVRATVDSHRKLWGAGIYVHPDVKSPSQRLAVSVWVKDTMGLDFLDEKGDPVPSLADFITGLLSESLQIHGEDKERLRRIAVNASAKGGGSESVTKFLAAADGLRREAGIGNDNEFDISWLSTNKGWRLDD